MICVNREEKNKTVLVVSEKGYGKRTPIDEYRITNRGGKGVKTISVTEKTGKLVGILDPTESEDLMITCKSGVTIRMSVAGISSQGRATQGVKLIRLDESDEIAAITKLDKLEEETNGHASVEPSAEGAANGATSIASDGTNIASDGTDSGSATGEQETDNDAHPIDPTD
jgi:DNA gyrase subunit A